MATQQQPVLDANQATLTSPAVRDAWRRKDDANTPASHDVGLLISQLRSYAHLEARTWIVRSKAPKTNILENKLKDAKDAVESRCQMLRNMATAGHTLRGDAALLVEQSPFLRITFQKTQAGLDGSGRLPIIHDMNSCDVPRAYAAATRTPAGRS